MRRREPVRARLLAIALVFASAITAAGQQGAAPPRVPRLWYDAYLAGVDAIRAGQWDRAVTLLEASLKANPPAQGQRVRFQGSSVRSFIADYYLGVAYLNLRNYKAADDAFGRVAASRTVASGDPEYKQFVTQSQEAKIERVLADSAGALAAGDLKGAASLAQQATALPGASAGERTRLNDLDSQIRRAQAAANAATSPAAQTPPQPVPSGAPGGGATQPNPPPVTPAQPQPNVNPPVNPPTVPPPTPDVAAPKAIPTPPTTSPAIVAPKSATTTRPAPPRPAAPVPLAPPVRAADETQAIVAFFSGDYREAAGMLRALTLSPAASPRSRFYYACSLAALVYTGEIGAAESTLAEARAEWQRAGGSAPFDRDRRLISPRILRALEAR